MNDRIAPAPFIIGAPRSGTTLLRLMLDSHPELAIPGETHFLFDVFANPEAQSLDANLFADQLTRHFTWPDYGVGEMEFRQALLSLDPFAVGAGLRLFYTMYAARFGKSRWGEKTPDYSQILPEIKRALPEAHFIYLIRDGRDVAVSKRPLWFGAGPDIEAQAHDWVDHVETARRLADGCRDYMEIRYEHLVRAPERTLRAVCAFLALPYSAEMLDYPRRAEERVLEAGSWFTLGIPAKQLKQLHVKTASPPAEDRVGRWRTELTQDEATAFEAIAGETLRSCGYDVS